MPPFNLIGDGRQFSPSHSSQYSVLEMIVGADKEKEPWKYIFLSEEKRGRFASKFCENRILCGGLK